MNSLSALVLMPPADVHSGLVELSQVLHSTVTGEILLGPDCLPHITVIQTDASVEEVLAIAKGSADKWARDDTVTLAGMSLVPSDGQVWLEVAVLKSKKLADLQGAIVARLQSEGFRAVSGAGDFYRPHVTLGLVAAFNGVVPHLRPDLLRSSSIGWTLAVTELGPNFTVPAATSVVSIS